MPIPRPPAEACGPDGSYHEYKTDALGRYVGIAHFCHDGPSVPAAAGGMARAGSSLMSAHALARMRRSPLTQSASPACVKRGMQKDGWFGFF